MANRFSKIRNNAGKITIGAAAAAIIGVGTLYGCNRSQSPEAAALTSPPAITATATSLPTYMTTQMPTAGVTGSAMTAPSPTPNPTSTPTPSPTSTLSPTPEYGSEKSVVRELVHLPDGTERYDLVKYLQPASLGTLVSGNGFFFGEGALEILMSEKNADGFLKALGPDGKIIQVPVGNTNEKSIYPFGEPADARNLPKYVSGGLEDHVQAIGYDKRDLPISQQDLPFWCGINQEFPMSLPNGNCEFTYDENINPKGYVATHVVNLIPGRSEQNTLSG